MKIAVIADTHGKFPAHVAEAISAADEIWHLGDFCDLKDLNAVKELGRPFYGVLGNNDYTLDLPEKLLLERHGRTFLLIHIPPAPARIGGADFLLHGHTHVPRDEMVNTTRVLNPGTIGKPNHGSPCSWAWLTVHEDGSIEWEVLLV